MHCEYCDHRPSRKDVKDARFDYCEHFNKQARGFSIVSCTRTWKGKKCGGRGATGTPCPRCNHTLIEYLPTPKAIHEGIEAIQATWTEEERAAHVADDGMRALAQRIAVRESVELVRYRMQVARSVQESEGDSRGEFVFEVEK